MWKSTAEIDKVYSEHIESLEMSGLPFDKQGIIEQWAKALSAFSEQENH